MVNLFVDCDDTLLLYLRDSKINPYGFWKHIPFKPNEDLIEDMRKFRQSNPKSTITVWSGGGLTYARDCVIELGIAGIVDRYLLKIIPNPLLITEEVIVVDDDNLDGNRTHTPFERF